MEERSKYKCEPYRTLIILDLALISWICDQKNRQQKQKKENDKINWSTFEIQSFCASKDTIKRVKRQLTGWEKIFASGLFHQGLIASRHKEPLQLSKTKSKPN